MKRTTFKLICGLLLPALMVAGAAKAQVNINVNIGAQPNWGPSGYQQAQYYYLPDIDSYYDVSGRQFVYLTNGRWIFSPNLPPRYRNYDLYSGYKVVVNRPRPYLNYNEDHVKYAQYRGWHGRQESIRDHGRGNPHGMPPGQAKKYYNNMPPGQAKKWNDDNQGDEGNHGNHGDHGDHGHGHGHDD